MPILLLSAHTARDTARVLSAYCLLWDSCGERYGEGKPRKMGSAPCIELAAVIIWTSDAI